MKNPPKWLGCIPQGSHGSGIVQKKYWKVISDIVRIRDFYEFGVCISCNRKPETWSIADWQACHYNPYSVCRGYSKFHLDNIFGGCSYCNRGFNGAPSGALFKQNIVNRYGKERMEWLETFQSMPIEKMYDGEIVEKIRVAVISMKDLPEQPEYYHKILDNPEFMI